MLEQRVVCVVDQDVVEVAQVDAVRVHGLRVHGLRVDVVEVDVTDVRAVDQRRMNIIDAASGGRFHHAMTDQRFRAKAFERLLRWQRMRHELMEPIPLPEPTELQMWQGAVTPSEELSAPRPSAVS
jgi:hypothetical protein